MCTSDKYCVCGRDEEQRRQRGINEGADNVAIGSKHHREKGLYTLASGSRILGILPDKGYSHQQIGTKLLFALAERGHKVTMVTALAPNKEHGNVNIIEVDIKKFALEETMDLLNTDHTTLEASRKFLETQLRWTESLLNDTNVQTLIKSKTTFDAVIIDQITNYAHKGLCHYFKAVCIDINVSGATLFSDDQIGNTNNPAYTPNRLLPLTTAMNFKERLFNSLFTTQLYLNYHYTLIPSHNEVVQKYFPGSPQLYDIMYNTSLSLVNSHYITSACVPKIPTVVEIGGIHMDLPKELPKHIKDYLDNSENGIIYFSMGSILKSKNMKKNTIDDVLKAFSKVKQNILWKFEDENLQVPSNVKIIKWAPQVDVLAHPNIRLFITHAGLLSITEAINFGVPIIGIPIFSDQHLNAAFASEHGYGVTLEYHSLTEEKLNNAIDLVLTNSRFRKSAMERSNMFRDQLNSPLETAVYWVEYCINHQGCRHLRSPVLRLQCRCNANREHQEFNIEETINMQTDLVNLILNDIIHTVFEKVCHKHNEKRESNERSNNNLNGKKIIVKINNIWLQHLHWPKVEKTNTKRKSNSPMPFAITTKKWKEYTDAIETEKKEKELQKLQRKTSREKKQEKNGKKEKHQLPTHSFEVRFLAERLAVLTNIEGAVIENCVVKSLLNDKFGEKILFSYPADRSKSSLAFMGNIPLTEIIEHVRKMNSKNIIIETAKALRQELLKTELIPSGYLRDENLVQKLFENGKLSETWEIFLQVLFNAKNQKLSANYNKKALSVFYDIFFIVTEKQTPKHIALAESFIT
ncbi:hypothetical protein FQA39_LY14372 [Lamprigera yunnana]|nr:hypothetical protein FQA39_LY14372 [Lamprigera yunnana]